MYVMIFGIASTAALIGYVAMHRANNPHTWGGQRSHAALVGCAAVFMLAGCSAESPAYEKPTIDTCKVIPFNMLENQFGPTAAPGQSALHDGIHCSITYGLHTDASKPFPSSIEISIKLTTYTSAQEAMESLAEKDWPAKPDLIPAADRVLAGESPTGINLLAATGNLVMHGRVAIVAIGKYAKTDLEQQLSKLMQATLEQLREP